MRGNNRNTRPLALPQSFAVSTMTDAEWAVLGSFQADADRLLLLVRFWSKVAMKGEDECWEWRDDLLSRPNFSWKGVDYIAARLAYEMAIGPLPAGLFACHSCDNGQCVNPKHLFPGTLQENNADCTNKGRMQRGEAHYRAKLIPEQVIDIRRRYAAGGISQAALAREYGVIQEAISKIIHRKTWKHVA